MEIHRRIVARTGGGVGVRDQGQLESALLRPFQEVFGTAVHATPAAKAAAVLQEIIIRHPMVDGNKRLGFALMMLLLAEAGLSLRASSQELIDMTLSVAKAELDHPALVAWLEPRLQAHAQ